MHTKTARQQENEEPKDDRRKQNDGKGRAGRRFPEKNQNKYEIHISMFIFKKKE